LVLIAASSEDKLHIATEGRAEKFAVLQNTKKLRISQFEVLIHGGMIVEEAWETVDEKVSMGRDQARNECTNALLKAMSKLALCYGIMHMVLWYSAENLH